MGIAVFLHQQSSCFMTIILYHSPGIQGEFDTCNCVKYCTCFNCFVVLKNYQWKTNCMDPSDKL